MHAPSGVVRQQAPHGSVSHVSRAVNPVPFADHDPETFFADRVSPDIERLDEVEQRDRIFGVAILPFRNAMATQQPAHVNVHRLQRRHNLVEGFLTNKRNGHHLSARSIPEDRATIIIGLCPQQF